MENDWAGHHVLLWPLRMRGHVYWSTHMCMSQFPSCDRCLRESTAAYPTAESQHAMRFLRLLRERMEISLGLRWRRRGESLPFIGCALFSWGSCLWEASTCHMLALNRTRKVPDLFIELKFKGWQFMRMRLGLEWRHLLGRFWNMSTNRAENLIQGWALYE